MDYGGSADSICLKFRDIVVCCVLMLQICLLWCSQNAEEKSGDFLSAEFEPLDLERDDFITSFDYLMEKESLIIGTSSGLLLLHMVDGNSTEVVGRVEGGVKCISPSPDGDLLAVTTGVGQLLVLTHDWDVLYEATFEDPLEDIDVSKDSSNEPVWKVCLEFVSLNFC